MQISGSIVLFESKKEYAEKVIENFFATDLEVFLYLVDNSPTNELQYLAELDERIEYLHFPQNLGFGKGHNVAINKILGKSRYHVVLNHDIEFNKQVLEELYSFMEKNEDIGSVMPKVLYESGEIQPLCKLLPTPLTLFSRRFARNNNFTEKLNERYELKEYNYKEILEVPNLSGCFMFIRNSVIQKTGGFDENFFLYLEDVDLNRRIGKIAKTIVYPYLTIKHHFQKGSYQNYHLLKHHIKSAVYYFNKWGWFFDKGRAVLNNKTINAIKSSNNKQ